MPGFSPVFGSGGPIYPAQQSYLALSLTADTTLDWPLEQQIGGSNIAAAILGVTANAGPFAIILEDARLVSNGYAILFDNLGANSFTVEDTGGNTLLTVASGEAWVLYLRDNSTANGTWRSFQQGAGTSSANAASLAGAGLKANVTVLDQRWQINSRNADYTLVDGDRAKVVKWTGGVGTFTLPNPATVGADWFASVKNSGTGSVTLVPAAGTIDGSASLVMAVGESCFVVSDGTNWLTVGFGQEVNSVFDFVSIDVSGTGDLTLSGAQLNRISYEFTGILTGNRGIVVPASIQQYWVDNQTTGAFSLTIKASGGDPGVVVTQGERAILYCDGTNVVLAQTIGSLTFGDGSAASPSITWTTQQTMGLYKAGTNIIGVATAGVARGTIDAEGNWVLNGPSSGTDPTLTVTGINGQVGVLSVTSPFTNTATAPGLLVRSTAVGGFGIISICADSNTPGTDDIALLQNSTNLGILVNRAGAGLSFMDGATTVMQLNAAAAQVVLGTAIADNIRINNITSATIGAAGAAAALPAQPLGYWTLNVNGASVKIPFYNP